MKDRAELIQHFLKFKFESASNCNYLEEIDYKKNELKHRNLDAGMSSQNVKFSSSLMLALALIYPGGKVEDLKGKSLKMVSSPEF